MLDLFCCWLRTYVASTATGQCAATSSIDVGVLKAAYSSLACSQSRTRQIDQTCCVVPTYVFVHKLYVCTYTGFAGHDRESKFLRLELILCT